MFFARIIIVTRAVRGSGNDLQWGRGDGVNVVGGGGGGEGWDERNHRQITAESTSAFTVVILMWRRLFCDSYTFTQFTFNCLQPLFP